MSKKLCMLLAVVVMCGLISPAFAAVENVKVGGDMGFKMIYRADFDFQSDDVVKLNPHFMYMGTRVYVSADLTDNVSTMVRIINERDAGNDYLREISGSLLIDLGYVKVADIMVPGLTLTLGRQEIQIGEGLVVGSRYRALDYLGADIGTAAVDYGLQKAFDAVRVDYAVQAVPVTLTGFKAKILESYGLGVVTLPFIGTVNLGDVDLWGASLLWKPESVSLEPYLASLNAYHNDITVMTGGVRGTWDPAALEGLSLKGEFAKQFGDINPAGLAMKAAGWAGYIGGKYVFPVNMKPSIGAVYSYFSGWDGIGSDIKSWIPVFPANIADRVGKIAYPALFAAGEGNVVGVPSGLTQLGSGLQSIKACFGLEPMEKLDMGLDVFFLRTNEAAAAGTSKTLGTEIDLGLKYAYTEDLSLGFDLGYLMRGGYIKDNLAPTDTKNAWQAIASVNVAF